ncbi:MAG: deaminase [Candidatus Nanoarchaeia archaeon]
MYTKPGWDDYFLIIARSVSLRGTCLRRRYGAVVVKDTIIVSTGYCGAASKLEDCLQKGTCVRQQLGVPSGERYDLCKSVHAEENALQRSGLLSRGAKLYIAGENYDGTLADGKPCRRCARSILNAGIADVVIRLSDGGIKLYTLDELRDLADSVESVKK